VKEIKESRTKLKKKNHQPNKKRKINKSKEQNRIQLKLYRDTSASSRAK
jgi:hypothetical protein